MPQPQKATVAICYDFDGTLIRGNMQENSFLPQVNVPTDDFWTAVKERAREHDMDEVLAYMQLMIDAAGDANKRIDRKALRDHGSKVDLFPGVDTWFQAINQYCKTAGAKVEHFVISSGLQEMIVGSPIWKEFTHIFASGFSYDIYDVPKFPARSVNYTTKTQYLFRINKGILNSWDNETINKFTPDENRPRPFSRMIYIGDGDTDVPAMKMLNYQGGYTIAVYPPKEQGRRRSPKEMNKVKNAKKLVTDNRAQFAVGADYSENGPVYQIVTMLIRRIVGEYALNMNLDA